MSQPSIQKLFAFIMAIMMFSAIPGVATAQKKCPKGHCPKGSVCVDGNCVPLGGGGGGCNCSVRPIPFSCGQICGFFAGTPENELISISHINSSGIGFELTKAQNVSFKIYDITGRLIKTLANSWMQQGDHQFEWNKTNETGSIVCAGVYILQLDAGAYTATKKLSVTN